MICQAQLYNFKIDNEETENFGELSQKGLELVEQNCAAELVDAYHEDDRKFSRTVPTY